MNSTSRAITEYASWLHDEVIDQATKLELQSIADRPKEIEERFYKDLEFGTGGLRGIIGVGTNRMNSYTIGRATQGLADYLLSSGGKDLSAVIAYDSRNRSPEFALEAALVLAGNGITAYVFDALRPTPELSFAVRQLKASAGIVITASHNPPEYNGYKVYGSDGGQLVTRQAEQVTDRIQEVASFAQIRKLPRQEAEARGLLRWIGGQIDDQYIAAVTTVSQNRQAAQSASDFCIIYSPLHGAGNRLVRGALHAIGFTNVHVVSEQEQPDPLFSTVKSPNPEEKEAFTLAIEQGKRLKADLLIATDPDCDRMGAAVKNGDEEYTVLSGNQSGAILTYYLLESMKQRNELPDNGVLIKTIVTSEMGAIIAKSYGVAVVNTLTGFKYIGEKITEYEKTGEHRFIFGYEESYGYLAGTHARDKDAVVASMLICEAGAYHKSKGKSLYEVLQELYRTYGYFKESLQSRTLSGKDGLAKIGRIMEDWRSAPPGDIAGINVSRIEDYSQGINGLPKENVLKFLLEDGSWFCLRPSGTEPKIKVYFSVKGTTQIEADNRMDLIIGAVMSRVDQ